MNSAASAPEASIEIQPLSNPVSATVRIPGSKSYTNRALAVAGLAEGTSHLTGALFSDDTKYMAAALNAVGIGVQSDASACTFDVNGQGGRVAEVDTDIFVGNAGTAARFLTALLCLGQGRYRIDGVQRMRERPMADMLLALRKLGATIEENGLPGCFPITVSGKGRGTGPVAVSLPGSASSQFISGLVLSGPHFGGDVEVRVEGELVSKPYLDMTQAVMRDFGVELVNHNYERFTIAKGQHYQATRYSIEPDASAASYFFAAAAITGGTVTVEGLGSQSQQGDLDIVHILAQMGAMVEQEPNRTTVTGTGTLRGVEVDMKNLSDVAQTLAVVAPFASSPVRITGIGFIRNKETDRVGFVVKELNRLGIEAFEESDGYTIKPGTPKPGRVHTYDDHRMAMSFALLGLRHPGITILNPACTSKTFPNYFEVLETLRR
jgi:3-phosphoshikimate 1-carboxyvinyltransferase